MFVWENEMKLCATLDLERAPWCVLATHAAVGWLKIMMITLKLANPLVLGENVVYSRIIVNWTFSLGFRHSSSVPRGRWSWSSSNRYAGARVYPRLDWQVSPSKRAYISILRNKDRNCQSKWRWIKSSPNNGNNIQPIRIEGRQYIRQCFLILFLFTFKASAHGIANNRKEMLLKAI